MEPFGIYITDLTYKQYEDMNNHISDMIKTYKKNFAESYKIYRSLTGKSRVEYGYSGSSRNNADDSISALLNIMQKLDSENSLKDEILNNGYKLEDALSNDLLSKSEIMKHILELDGGLLLMTGISIVNSHLLSAISTI